MLPQAPVWLLTMDPVTILRPATAVDAEGDPTGALGSSFSSRGTLLSISAREQLAAQQRGTSIDKALGCRLGTDINEGDMVTVGGATYEVVAAENRRLYRRLQLRNTK